MDPTKGDIAKTAKCTTCAFSEDFSNYWTAVMFFRARNGSYHRVPQISNDAVQGTEGGGGGGMIVYYMQDPLANMQQTSKVTAFKPGFRMLVGEAGYRTKDQAARFRQLTFTCLETLNTRFPETLHFPKKPCKAGIMANTRFPTCWDGKNLDSPDHMSHMSYPETGTFESGGPCPKSHPVRVPQLMFETIWDTRQFNDPDLWPEDGSQPFLWSMNDSTGYGSHGDYVFGWLDDSLQRAVDSPCYVNCPTLKTQSTAAMSRCKGEYDVKVDEKIDGCECLPFTFPLSGAPGRRDEKIGMDADIAKQGLMRSPGCRRRRRIILGIRDRILT